MAKGASLTSVATAALLMLFASGASALSLGRLTVQSSLGEALRAEIDITSMSPEEAASLRTALASPEAFRAAGVEFNPVLANAQLTLARRPDGRSYIRLTGDRAVSEPFVDVIIDFAWASGRLQRAYTLLIDPPTRPAAPPATATAPVFSPAAPVAPPPVAAAPRPAAPTPAPAPRPAAPPPAPRPAAPAPAPTGADTYRVRSGDTLSSIASSNLRGGVSLDQMLVSLYRGNPQAFIDNNMNRLRSGVVLDLPDAQAAQEVSTEEARKVIRAHSADFASFRQRLAGAVPTVKGSEPERQATGQVQAAVKDRKADTAATSPDKLTLSQGSARAGATEAKVSKEAEKKAAETRVAELSRNVQDLAKLQQAASAARQPTPAPAPATAAAKPGLIGVPAAPAPAPAAKPVAPPPAPPVPAPTPAVASKPAPAPAPVVAASPVASAPAPVAAAASVAPVASAPASAAVAAASAPVAAASARPAPPKRAPKPAPAPEPSFFESLTSSPWVLPAAAGLVALLAGLGVMRLRRRQQDGAAETSFIESKLQPDSFFGVSGGQRVDTRDGASSSSSLSYSLSQLDAIGDVDPVAEADVYLAYGRDLQAEEILKEALRSDPGRVAIRSKLLEVYAKRADTKAFEAQARQLQEQTGGEGEEWDKAVELGRGIDPANQLYGGEGRVMAVDIDTSSEPPPDLREDFGAKPAAGLGEEPVVEKTQPFGEVLLDTAPADLDIDLGSPSSLVGVESTRPLDTARGLLDTAPGDLRAPAAPAPKVPELSTDNSLDLPMLELPQGEPERDSGPTTAPSTFDFGDLSLDLGAPKEEESTVRGGLPADEIDEADPLARKLELADEFRRIGDMEGARDLLEEVVSKADGALQARAQAMLDDLE
ncbi:MAG: FimV/HubP family polar landmark protein [Pseudomonadota bacterium]